MVRNGKGQRDRVVYLSDTACLALQLYLGSSIRPPQAALFTFADGQPISYIWLYEHIIALAQDAGIPHVTPHRLRHTLATRLLNAGMDITRIQKLLGHEQVNTTMIYARVHDHTVESDYRQAMTQIERQQLPLSNIPFLAEDWLNKSRVHVCHYRQLRITQAGLAISGRLPVAVRPGPAQPPAHRLFEHSYCHANEYPRRRAPRSPIPDGLRAAGGLPGRPGDCFVGKNTLLAMTMSACKECTKRSEGIRNDSLCFEEVFLGVLCVLCGKLHFSVVCCTSPRALRSLRWIPLKKLFSVFSVNSVVRCSSLCPLRYNHPQETLL